MDLLKKQDPIICYLQETHFRCKNRLILKAKKWKKIFYVNINERDQRWLY